MLAARAIDHGLRVGCGRVMADFIPHTYLGRLSAQEDLHFVQVDDLPPQYRRPGALQRACVSDATTKTQRLLLPEEMIRSPAYTYAVTKDL